jgi:uncharacterized C2H2 Zn-finger protein
MPSDQMQSEVHRRTVTTDPPALHVPDSSRGLDGGAMTDVSGAPVAEPERVTPMKPSEAMRLGRLFYPLETEGRLACPVAVADESDAGWALCAFGAMLVGSGRYAPVDLVDPPPAARMVYPELLRSDPGDERCYCPECGRVCRAPGYVVSHLNDGHRWPTERIASWLEEHGL